MKTRTNLGIAILLCCLGPLMPGAAQASEPVQVVDVSIFLAKVLGLYLLIVGLVLLLRPRALIQLMKEFFDNSSALMLGGIVTLIIGILLVVSHNIWVADWPILITLLAWISLGKGIHSLFFPESRRSMVRKFENPNVLRVIGVIDILLGAFLAYQGYSL